MSDMAILLLFGVAVSFGLILGGLTGWARGQRAVRDLKLQHGLTRGAQR